MSIARQTEWTICLSSFFQLDANEHVKIRLVDADICHKAEEQQRAIPALSLWQMFGHNWARDVIEVKKYAQSSMKAPICATEWLVFHFTTSILMKPRKRASRAFWVPWTIFPGVWQICPRDKNREGLVSRSFV